jgi:hypothetical protein
LAAQIPLGNRHSLLLVPLPFLPLPSCLAIATPYIPKAQTKHQ